MAFGHGGKRRKTSPCSCAERMQRSRAAGFGVLRLTGQRPRHATRPRSSRRGRGSREAGRPTLRSRTARGGDGRLREGRSCRAGSSELDRSCRRPVACPIDHGPCSIRECGLAVRLDEHRSELEPIGGVGRSLKGHVQFSFDAAAILGSAKPDRAMDGLGNVLDGDRRHGVSSVELERCVIDYVLASTMQSLFLVGCRPGSIERRLVRSMEPLPSQRAPGRSWACPMVDAWLTN